MKKALLVILSILIVCSTQAKHRKHKKTVKQVNKIEAIKMQRTACYGRCPAYKIELSKDGNVIYTAIRFTVDSGVFEKNIGEKGASDIFDQALTTKVDTCKNEYMIRPVDLPGLIFTITYDDSTKIINNANFGPEVLKKLADKMDEITGKKVDETWHRKIK
jgi:hypothetical protein